MENKGTAWVLCMSCRYRLARCKREFLMFVAQKLGLKLGTAGKRAAEEKESGGVSYAIASTSSMDSKNELDLEAMGDIEEQDGRHICTVCMRQVSHTANEMPHH
uniref:Uncharacterized protein n=1 Tax=Palpitomonas bilix TaxID=652834 RepID=A0A7S3D8B5_9EUKA|mmetsp:Transcript_24437/g.61849  ORF Transcript_24437/g.61849 Transcript_24437/m.61849 type:complete len:104 (+) Transcript_24437:95-406(+)